MITTVYVRVYSVLAVQVLRKFAKLYAKRAENHAENVDMTSQKMEYYGIMNYR